MHDENFEATELLEESIRASNRTTRAVRAIAILFLYLIPFQLAAGLVGGVSFILMSSAIENPALWAPGFAIAILILLIGVFFTITAASRELRKSKVLAGPDARVFEARDVLQNLSFTSDPLKE